MRELQFSFIDQLSTVSVSDSSRPLFLKSEQNQKVDLRNRVDSRKIRDGGRERETPYSQHRLEDFQLLGGQYVYLRFRSVGTRKYLYIGEHVSQSRAGSLQGN